MIEGPKVSGCLKHKKRILSILLVPIGVKILIESSLGRAMVIMRMWHSDTAVPAKLVPGDFADGWTTSSMAVELPGATPCS
jgi:hypothetical protein